MNSPVTANAAVAGEGLRSPFVVVILDCRKSAENSRGTSVRAGLQLLGKLECLASTVSIAGSIK
jgi:hypothetical protein